MPGLAFLLMSMLVLAASGSFSASAQQARTVPDDHTVLRSDEIAWGPASAKLPPGAVMAILDGSPAEPDVPFTIRVKVPDGFSVPPHTHPTDEHLTVIQGTILLGTGEEFDREKLRELSTGSYASLPAGEPHFNLYRGETIIQLHGIGPYDIVYVDPADDPSR